MATIPQLEAMIKGRDVYLQHLFEGMYGLATAKKIESDLKTLDKAILEIMS